MNDSKSYIDIFTEPLKECLAYKPKFGISKRAEGVSLSEFLSIYGRDPFYSSIGLNSPYMYAAHKAAGGMTSIYRQIGIGCERLFRQVIFDSTSYSDYASTGWSYMAKTKSGKDKVMHLDARLELSEINDDRVKTNVEKWIKEYSLRLGLGNKKVRGAVFEVRQGYKSKDSKRQNGDLDNATVAYAYNYLPIFAIFSSQIDKDLVLRYTNSKCGILTGMESGDVFSSLFSFSREVLGYDLLRFFKDNTAEIRDVVENTLKALLVAK